VALLPEEKEWLKKKRKYLTEKWKLLGVQIGAVSVFALVLVIILSIIFSRTESLPEAIKSAITATGALSLGGVAVIQLRKHKTDETQAQLDYIIKQKQLEAMEQDREVKQKQLASTKLDRQTKQTEIDAKISDRLTKAIERLRSSSLEERLGALFELKKIGAISNKDQADIVRILSPLSPYLHSVDIASEI